MNTMNLEPLINFFFIFFPIVGYLPQIITLQSVFPPLLSTITIIANLLKIFYYKVNKYEKPILYQSFVVIGVHSFLLYFYNKKLSYLEEKIFKHKNLNRIYQKYGLFTLNMILITFIALTLNCFCFINGMENLFIGCGFLSLTFESLVGVIQIVINKVDNKKLPIGIKKQRCGKELFFCWFFGDLSRFVWMIWLKSPVLLVLSVVFQIGIDLALIFDL
ncbi:hypothetical protein CWI38_0975p0020 [Hamiltosporidium tvaerminnensis]|uniref:Uncharacterized protein n=1 Tax=Hamiltosporidium tvaerminnensis TaxID=1176355 RepID=A0A4Q9LTK1_9MICR|nr:hypothetical protein CWI38_0975p0020 [Hamiltosporidium tvaerminnensis]